MRSLPRCAFPDLNGMYERPYGDSSVLCIGFLALLGSLVQLAYLASVCDLSTFALHGMFGLEYCFEWHAE